MIQTLFLGKQEYGRLSKVGALPPTLWSLRSEIAGALDQVVQDARARGATPAQVADALMEAGFTGKADAWSGDWPVAGAEPPQRPGLESAGLWFEGSVEGPARTLGRALLREAARTASRHLDGVSADDRRVIDYGLVTELGFPAYLGGPLALAEYLGARVDALA